LLLGRLDPPTAPASGYKIPNGVEMGRLCLDAAARISKTEQGGIST
jgi:hypothetical protein